MVLFSGIYAIVHQITDMGLRVITNAFAFLLLSLFSQVTIYPKSKSISGKELPIHSI